MKKPLILLLLLISASVNAQTWPGQCPSGTLASAIGCQPEAVSPQPTDLILGWQIGQSPHTRAFQLQQIITENGGPFLPLAGGTMTGTLGQNINTVWSGNSYPGTNNVANYSVQHYSGTPSAGFPDTGAPSEIPLNLWYIANDTINQQLNGSVVGWNFVYRYGGSGSAGTRTGLTIDMMMTGANTTNAFFTGAVSFNVVNGATANYVGAAPGSKNGIGDYFGMSMYYGNISSGVYTYSLAAAEYDYIPKTGSETTFSTGLKFVNAAPVGWHAIDFESVLSFSSAIGHWNHVIVFGDPEGGGTSFPGSATGDLFYAFAGTTGIVMEFSNLTVTNYLLKGPNGFGISGSGNIITNAAVTANVVGGNSITLQGASAGNTVQLFAGGGTNVSIGYTTKGSGNHIFFGESAGVVDAVITTVASAISYPTLTPAASGNILFDVGGTGTGISIGAATATLVKLGSATADQILGSGVFLPALNTTTGFAHLPFTNASSGAGGIPTGTPANTSGPACAWNDVTFTLNCYSPSAGAWKHVTLSASAG